jgi:hypothetical protein
MPLAEFQWFWDFPSWNWSYAWAVAFLLVPFACAWIVRVITPRKPRPFIDIVNGADGQWSTSKTAVVFWTFAIWFAFLAILFHTQGEGLTDMVLQGEYFVVLGVPAAAAIAAKGIVTSKVDSGEIVRETGEPNSNVVQGAGELVSDTSGRTDMLDFQYFGFTLILLSFFVLGFFARPDDGLPDLPDTLLALSGVSAFAYVSKKGLAKDIGPTLGLVTPPSAAPGDPVTIRGVNLASSLRRTADVMFGSLTAPSPTVTVLEDVAELATTVPSNAPSGEVDLVVVAFDGRSSEPVKFTIT